MKALVERLTRENSKLQLEKCELSIRVKKVEKRIAELVANGIPDSVVKCQECLLPYGEDELRAVRRGEEEKKVCKGCLREVSKRP